MSTPKGVTPLTKKEAGEYDALKDVMGRFRTQSLFIEKKNSKYPAPFTLKDYDHKGALSMYKRYMEIGDPTEYAFALAMFGSWAHWRALSSAPWFEEYVVRWREELKVKFESDRWYEMQEVAENQAGSPLGVNATKWLADRYNGAKPKRGRPSKEEKKKILKEESEEDKLLAEEAQRLGL